jgi:hypothetical protein
MATMAGGHASRDRLASMRRAAGGLDKFSFLLIFLIGSAGIVTLRAYFSAGQGYVIAWSVSWMLVYLMLVTLVPRYRLRPDQAGDNIYYLGFLYTLVSLSVALYFFTYDDAAVRQIISNFGIALATTIFGIALRIVLHQMREDPIDTEREARQSLAEVTNRLRAELDVSVREMSSFSRQMRQSVEEALAEVGKQAGKLLTDSGGQVAQAAKSASEGIEQALSAFTEHAKSLNTNSRRHIEATEKLIGRIDAIEVPVDLIDRKVAPAVDQIVKLVETKLSDVQARVVEAQFATVRQHMVIVEDLRAKVKRQIEEFEAQLRELRESGSREILQAMQGLAERQTEAYGRIARQADESLESLRRSRQAMDVEVQEARDATREVMHQLTSMVQTLGQELGGYRPAR